MHRLQEPIRGNFPPHFCFPGARQHFAVLAGLTVVLGLVIVGAVHVFFANRIAVQDSRNAFLKTQIAQLDKQINEIKKLKGEIQALLARKHVIETLQTDRAQTVHLMDELVRLQATARPHHTLLIADAMTGQGAVNVAQGVHERLNLSGLILTKLDSDARGGAALSVRAVTGAPILFAGLGEQLSALEVFHPDRLASRILGMGDMLSLIEKAQQNYDQNQAKELERKFKKNEFTLEDFAEQMVALQKMGSLGDLLGMIPGFKKIASQVDSEQAQEELGRARTQGAADSDLLFYLGSAQLENGRFAEARESLEEAIRRFTGLNFVLAHWGWRPFIGHSLWGTLPV